MKSKVSVTTALRVFWQSLSPRAFELSRAEFSWMGRNGGLANVPLEADSPLIPAEPLSVPQDER